ncbi:pyridoxal phosphate-dependent aminotransferase [Streptomyces sp. NPDC052043]|uniref:pyridoxal phosphate-dependent aminotransferase n=1 Tax=Streptomyces sp. NPDC052043 TaxID=3365684 RepID=UPI0037D4FEA9
MTMHSATLAINETIQARRAAGEKVLHLGFGEAGLPVPDQVAAALAEAAGRNSYGPVVGSHEAREAAAGWFTRRNLTTDPDQVLFAPGSKALLFALLAALPGDLVLPCPAWVSYAAQAAIVNKHVIDVPIPAESGGIPDPALLEQALTRARASGAEPGVLLLTVPDNPTGTVARPEHLREVCAIADRHGLVIVSDEIYGELCHNGGPAPSAASYLPDRTVVTSGLSKATALGGWRIGFARVPDGPWGAALLQDVIGIASEVWSSLAAPMQAAAAYVLADPADVTDHIAASRRLHATVARAVHNEFVRAGATCRAPQAGFYLYPDFEPVRADLAHQGITTGAQLASALLERQGVGVLAGEAFGDEAQGLRARVATSLLYGESAGERWEALRSDDPLTLPWIAGSLNHLRDALAALVP